jgi:hypothetical protein
MPARLRAPKERRPPPFGPEVIALFRELDATPARARGHDDFKVRERELMRALDLADEWRFSMCSVLSRDREPCHPPGNPAAIDWYRVRRVREALLAAVKQGQRREAGDGILDGREDGPQP